jgi:DNA-binding Lrp family transcriptional regulator
VSVSAHCLLHQFFGSSTGGHPGVVEGLTTAQVDALRPAPVQDGDPVHLDDGDHTLLAALARDGRASYAELAAVTGWSESTTGRRVEQLRRCGVLYFDADLKLRPFGFGLQAVLWMSVSPSDLAGVGAALTGHPEVAFAAATTGSTNLVATVVCRDVRALYRYLTERLGTLPAVRHIETTPVIRTLKSAGSLTKSLPPGPGKGG